MVFPWRSYLPLFLDFGFCFGWLPCCLGLIFRFNIRIGPPVGVDLDPTASDSRYIGLSNYQRVVADPKFYKAIRNSSLYVLGTVLMILPLAFALALSLRGSPACLGAFFFFV